MSLSDAGSPLPLKSFFCPQFQKKKMRYSKSLSKNRADSYKNRKNNFFGPTTTNHRESSPATEELNKLDIVFILKYNIIVRLVSTKLFFDFRIY
jgi:hypothetical protein